MSSKALTVGQAKDYYQKEYSNANGSYYSEQEKIAGEWRGTLAEEWGLHGTVDAESFERLCDGKDPLTGEQLVKHVAVKEYENQYGDTVITSEHRAGWDATFSAPKSVSLAALVGGDERIKEAHRESVNIAMGELEKFAEARLSRNRVERTGKFVAALFEHDASRPDKKTGYAAPQLHTHAVIFNMAETADGKIRSMQPEELYRSQQYATAIYRQNLTERLQKLGYEMEIDDKGAPQIKGFSKEYLDASSPRRREVEQQAREMKERMAEQGIEVKDGAGLMQAAARNDRRSKKYDRAEMRQRHLEMDAEYGHQAKRAVERALERGPVISNAQEIENKAKEAVTFARDNATEREAVADMRKVYVDSLRRNLGLTTYEAVDREIKSRQERGEFISIENRQDPRQRNEMTTRQMVRMESANIAEMLDGKDKQKRLAQAERTKEIISKYQTEKNIYLNQGQRFAIEQVLGSQDRIVGLQGRAGTGKTTVLSVIRSAAEREGYTVRGLAPSTRATQLLQESGISSRTLQKFLYEKQQQSGPRLFVIDESSLASTKNVNRFFAKIGPQDRVLLVGDTTQHQAIEAGSPFEQLQKQGMRTATLSEVVRQRDPELREAVKKLSQQQVREAITDLRQQGRVIGIADANERFKAIAADYCRQPQNTLVVAPANKERILINQLIHEKLQEKGEISKRNHKTKVLVARGDMTGAERTFAGAYQPGQDIIHYHRDSKVFGVKRDEYARVTAVDRKENTLTVAFENGRELTYNPIRLSGVSVYREEERQFAAGDRVQFRAPYRDKRIANGELGTIEKIEQDKYSIALDNGRKIGIDSKSFRQIDHGYALTSHSAQGQTVDRVLIHADVSHSEMLVNQRMGYVALSRARDEATIYTNSAKELDQAIDRQIDKRTALDAIGEREIAQHTPEREHSRQDQMPDHSRTQERTHGIERSHEHEIDRGYDIGFGR